MNVRIPTKLIQISIPTLKHIKETNPYATNPHLENDKLLIQWNKTLVLLSNSLIQTSCKLFYRKYLTNAILRRHLILQFKYNFILITCPIFGGFCKEI